MTLKRTPLRYSHFEGHTDVSYSNDGKHILTCGKGGDVRVWEGIDDDDPSSIGTGDSALGVCHGSCGSDRSRLYVATDMNSVAAFTFPDGLPDGITLRFTAPASHVAINKTGSVIAAAGQDMNVRVANLTSEGRVEKETILSGMKGPGLRVALCPSSKMVAASSGDGVLRVWNIETKLPLYDFNVVPKVNNFFAAQVLCQPSFEPVNAKYFAYPHGDEVVVVDTVNWGFTFALRNNDVEGEFSIAAYSPCGQYLAAATVKGYICVWHVPSKVVVGSAAHPNKQSVCSLAWNPQGNGELAYTDKSGQLGTLLECNKLQLDSQPIDSDMVSVADFDIADIDDANDDEDGENVISLEKIKAQVSGVGLGDVDGSESRPTSRQSSTTTHVATKIVSNLQSPFQPSSTPVHLTQRYMVWNQIGIVRAFDGDEPGAPCIEVDFHDKTFHNSMQMKNDHRFTMASLSTKALVLACEEPSRIKCIPLDSGGARDWDIELPEGEEVLCVAASERLIAVATNERLLRVFTVYGTQREVICIPGPVVSLASSSTCLLVAYHNGPGCNKDQNISMMIINIQGIRLVNAEVKVPLSHGATLTWLGLTESGSPVTYDSVGILRIFVPKSAVWMPLFDYSVHRKGVSDDLFLIQVLEKEQVLRAIVCKGSHYPAVSNFNYPMELMLQFPLCGIDENDKSQLEDQLFRFTHLDVVKTRQMAESSTADIVFKESAVKLFSLACRSDQDKRALELISLVHSHSPHLLSLSIKLAAKYGRMLLSGQLARLADEDENDEDDQGIVSYIHGGRLNAMAPAREIYIEKPSQESTVVIAPKAMTMKRNRQLRRPSVEENSSTVERKQRAESPSIFTPQSEELVNEVAESADIMETRESEDMLNETADSLNDVTAGGLDTPGPTVMSLLENTPKCAVRNPFSKNTDGNEDDKRSALEIFDDISKKNKENLALKSNEAQKKTKNPFKKQNMSKQNNPSVKRKQPDTEEVNPSTSKQSKLSAFAFMSRKD